MLEQGCKVDDGQGRETSSDDGAVNVSKFLDDDSFIESDEEDGCASAEYEGDEDDEDDNDDNDEDDE